MIRNPHERHESIVVPGEEGAEHCHYHDPVRILRSEGAGAVPSWYGTMLCCCCFGNDLVADLDRLYNPGADDEGERHAVGGGGADGNLNEGEAVPNATLTRMRRGARISLIIVAFFLAIAQWSATASGVEFISSLVGTTEDTAAAMTSALFSFCFLMSLVGGIYGDYRIGSPRILTIGLIIALAASVGIAIVLCPILNYGDAKQYLSAKVLIALFLFLFSGGLGLCQSSVPSLIGDQCLNDDATMNRHYIAFYGAIQAGAFIARLGFPEAHVQFDWFVAVCLFMVLPIALAIVTLALHSNALCYKIPHAESSALKAFKIAFRKGFMCATYEQLAGDYGWALVENAVQAISVLKLHLTLPIFWAIYFQMFELWYLQSKDMDLRIGGDVKLNPEQATVLNPLFDVVWLLMLSGLYRMTQTCFGYTISPYTKMFVGYLLATLSFIYGVGLQYYIVSQPRSTVSIWHQLPQYFILAGAEVLLYPAALQVAYVNAPVAMRNFIQSCLWFFIGIGNLIDMIVLLASEKMRDAHDPDSDDPNMRRNIEPLFIVYAVAMGLATIIYLLLATWFRQSAANRDDSSDTTLGPAAYAAPSPPSSADPSARPVGGSTLGGSRLLANPNSGGALRRPVSPNRGVVYYAARRSSKNNSYMDGRDSGHNTPSSGF